MHCGAGCCGAFIGTRGLLPLPVISEAQGERSRLTMEPRLLSVDDGKEDSSPSPQGAGSKKSPPPQWPLHPGTELVSAIPVPPSCPLFFKDLTLTCSPPCSTPLHTPIPLSPLLVPHHLRFSSPPPHSSFLSSFSHFLFCFPSFHLSLLVLSPLPCLCL